MSDYIKREDALIFARKAHGKGLNIIAYLKEVPAADVKPVVRGEWYNGDRNEGAQKVKLDSNGDVTDTAYCSVCGDWLCASDEYAARGRFCPNCGADMRRENEKND